MSQTTVEPGMVVYNHSVDRKFVARRETHTKQ